MNAVSKDVKDMLVADTDLGLVFLENLFIGYEPNKPNLCVTIFDSPGRNPQLTFNKTEHYEYPSIQIRVRDTEYLNAENTIHNIMESLHGRGQETWNDTLYSLIQCVSSPALLDWDENKRVRFIVNFNIQRR